MSATSGIPNGLYGYKTTVLSNNCLDADKLISRDWNASLIKGFICRQHQISDAGEPREYPSHHDAQIRDQVSPTVLSLEVPTIAVQRNAPLDAVL